MDYKPLNSFPYYKECASVTESLGYRLIELKITRSGNTTTKILAVISGMNSESVIGVDDCSKVHRVLLEKLEELLGTDDTYMELTSPGMERNIKNAAEFPLFTGRLVRVWDKTVTDWVSGKVVSAGEKSVVLLMEKDDGTKEEKEFSFENIAKAKLVCA